MPPYLNNIEYIQKGYQWLRDRMLIDESKVKHQLSTLKEKEGYEGTIQKLETRLKIKYLADDILPICVLSFFNDPIVADFKKAAEYPEFWDVCDILLMIGESEFYRIYFFPDIGLSSNTYFQAYFNGWKREQTVEGKIWNDTDHVVMLRLLMTLERDSLVTKKALEYGLENNYHLSEYPEESSSIFILDLMDHNCSKHLDTIKAGINFIKSRQKQDGSWGKEDDDVRYKIPHLYFRHMNTYFAIKALCRFNGSDDEHVKRGIEFIKNDQNLYEILGKNSRNTIFEEFFDIDIISFALLSLIATAPPFLITQEQYQFEKIQYEQRIDFNRSHFLHTSPPSAYDAKLPVKEIHDKIKEILPNAKHTIRIISLYIDMLYEDIITLKGEKPSLIIKIITRPKKDITGDRARTARGALDYLNIATKGNLKTLPTIHSRLIIIDDKEVILSSADLTRDGLVDQFNAGIYTRDPETIKKSIEYFENIWKDLEMRDKEKT